MRAKKLYYFAYGSNMLYSRIFNRVGVVKKVGVWRLEDWDMHFNCGRFTHSYANIFPSEGKVVDGVLYQLSDHQIEKLDGFENFPHNYEKRYFQHENGNLIYTYCSVAEHFKSKAKPDYDYLFHLIDGAKENGLIDAYDKLMTYKEENYTKEELANQNSYANYYYGYGGYDNYYDY